MERRPEVPAHCGVAVDRPHMLDRPPGHSRNYVERCRIIDNAPPICGVGVLLLAPGFWVLDSGLWSDLVRSGQIRPPIRLSSLASRPSTLDLAVGPLRPYPALDPRLSTLDHHF